MSGVAELIADIQRRLEARADPDVKAWWERYLKGAVSFRGVKMPVNRDEVAAWHRAWRLERRDDEAHVELVYRLLHQPLAEDKLAAVLLLEEHLIPQGRPLWELVVPILATAFDEGAIADWNTCDWLCVKVLGKLIARDGERCARAIAEWRFAPGLWRRRAAGVAFVNLAPRGDELFEGFTTLVLEISAQTVRCSERFAQTGTGWVLRELGKGAPDRVMRFIDAHLPLMSREGLERALQHMPPAERAARLVTHAALSLDQRRPPRA